MRRLGLNDSTTPPRSDLNSFLSRLAGEPGISKEMSVGLAAARAATLQREDDDRPFMTVLVRTQGRRIEALKDVLLCLAAQADQDFEVILLVHDAEAEARTKVFAVVARQPADFRVRISTVEVEGGARGVPLNRGIELARGRYLAAYDDDDIVFATWVEEFHKVVGDGAARVLRAVAATQEVSPTTWPNGQAGFSTSSWPSAEYAKTFDLFEHLVVNRSPFMSVAFPSWLFTSAGLAVDEQLAVCEDWDLVLRATMLAGVDDVPALTSIYRRWLSGTSSYTDHANSEWAEAEAEVIARLDGGPVLLPAGSVEYIRYLVAERETYAKLINSRAWRLARPLRGLVRVASAGRRLATRRPGRGQP